MAYNPTHPIGGLVMPPQNRGPPGGMVGVGPPQGRKHRHDDEEQGKLFVGGLSWDTTQETLLHYFARFGEVIDCVVMKNTESGRSRGFGFITFSDPSNIDAVLQSCPHNLDGRTIDPKSCNPRSMQKPKKPASQILPKVFLGGLPSSITETDLRSFFSRYGEVVEVVIMFGQEKKKSRGFGFLSFADEQACMRAVNEHFVNIQNKQVEIKRAEPRTNPMGEMTKVEDWGAPPPPQPQLQPQPHHPPPPQHMAHNGHQIAPTHPAYPGWGASAPHHAATYPPQYATPQAPHNTVPGHPQPHPQWAHPQAPAPWGQPQPHPAAAPHPTYTTPAAPPSSQHYPVYPPPTTPQPAANFWGSGHPPPHHVQSDPYHPMPAQSPHHHHHPAPVGHQYGGGPPTPAPGPQGYTPYSQYQSPSSVVGGVTKPVYSSSGYDYHQPPGAATSPPAAPMGYQAVTGDVSGSLGPQRGAVYGTAPSPYHPYRRT